MSIQPGTKLGPYEVVSAIGAGGMGEVYCATDSRLNRSVAIKVLPAEYAGDPERMARFEREARVLASLNHPHIATLHGFEESGAVRALVMELVEGPTLAEHIAQGPAPLEEALAIGRQVADALEYAHERGIVHRDLKPANVKLTPSGDVKVLDFGLAKALENEASRHASSFGPADSPTFSMNATRAGVLLGTAAYMSPEQARGKPVDRRADIWAFGVLMFEMLSGEQPYAGETASDSMAAVITREPDWNLLPATVPPHIHHLLRRCLQKDPRKRLRDIGDARLELDGPSGEPAAPAAPIPPRSAIPKALVGVVAISALAAGAALAWFLHPRATPAVVARVIQAFPEKQGITIGLRSLLAISPDGAKVAYVANQRLYLRPMSSIKATEIPDSAGAASPFFSPDSQWVGFFSGNYIKKAPLAGGSTVTMSDVGGDNASWGRDGTILVGRGFAGISSISQNGSASVVVVPPSSNMVYREPRFFPDGKSFVYVRGRPGDVEAREAVVRSFDHDDSSVVLRGARQVQYVSAGYLVYANNSSVFAAPFDVRSRHITGDALTVVDKVNWSQATDITHFAVSDTGTLIYLTPVSGADASTRLVSVDSAGKASLLPVETRAYSDPRVSPDGRRIAVHLQGDQNDIWVVDPARGAFSRISFNPDEDETPAWSPDGRTIAWSASRADLIRGIFMRPADGSGQERLVFKLDKHCHVREWLPDGKSLLLEIQNPATGTDIWRLELGDNPKLTSILQTPFNERNSRVSPDGRWIAYVSDESGRDEIYIQSFPGLGSKAEVTTAGGDQPAWSRDGRSLFYRGGGSMQQVTFTTGSPPMIGQPRALFPDRYESPQAGAHTGYDVYPDGRFLMIEPAQAQGNSSPLRPELVFVFNWFDELKQNAKPRK